MRAPLLLAEDDPIAAQYICGGFERAGRSVDTARDGQTALAWAAKTPYRVIVLDRMLPKLDGLSVLERLRATGLSTPVIILSGLAAVSERVRGLEHGADDYLAKPFHISELLARVAVLERRSATITAEQAVLYHRDISVDLLTRVATRNGIKLSLSSREFDILRCLLEYRGRTVARATLLREVWSYEFDPGSNFVDVHVSRLRSKLDEIGPRGAVKSVRGIGYALANAAS